MRRRVLPLILALVAVPGALSAQGSCKIDYEHQWNIFGQSTPNESQYWGGNVRVTCDDGRVFRADSLIMLKNGDQRLLIGNAYASDPEKTLTAATLNVYGGQNHVFAQNNVVVVDKVNGATFTGGFMDYYPAKSGQPSHGTIYGNSGDGRRPHAILKRKPAAPAAANPPAPGAAQVAAPPAANPTTPGAVQGQAPAPAPAQPPTQAPTAAPTQPPTAVQAQTANAASTPADTASTLVDGDRFEIQGQKVFHAYGNVVLTRMDMKGTAPEALYDPDADHLRLIGGATVTGQDVNLTGGVIDGTLVGNQFKDVTATFKAVLTSKDLRVHAPSLTVSFVNGEVQAMVALSAERSKRTATDGNVLAEAYARDVFVRADSINAMAPAQKLERVVAVGHAYGERQNDSIDVKNLPDIAKHDWVRGDTITGFFTDAKPAAAGARGNTRNGRNQQRAGNNSTPTDTVQRVLDKLVAVGANSNQASSVYRIVDDKKPKATPGISYLVAKTITVSFKDGQVSLVTADGSVRGMHLQPQPKPAGKEKPTAGRKVAESGAGAQPGATPASSAPTQAGGAAASGAATTAGRTRP